MLILEIFFVRCKQLLVFFFFSFFFILFYFYKSELDQSLTCWLVFFDEIDTN